MLDDGIIILMSPEVCPPYIGQRYYRLIRSETKFEIQKNIWRGLDSEYEALQDDLIHLQKSNAERWAVWLNVNFDCGKVQELEVDVPIVALNSTDNRIPVTKG